MTKREKDVIISALGSMAESAYKISKKARKNGNDEMADKCRADWETASELMLRFMAEQTA